MEPLTKQELDDIKAEIEAETTLRLALHSEDARRRSERFDLRFNQVMLALVAIAAVVWFVATRLI